METIAENIARKFDHLDGRKNRSAIFSHYREIDDSHLYPIFSSGLATRVAIQRLYRFEKHGYYLTGLELCLYLEAEISTIVNNPNL